MKDLSVHAPWWLAILFCVGCGSWAANDPPPPKPIVKMTPTLTVQAIDWYHQTVTLRTDSGYIAVWHLCDPPMQFYIGERAKVQYYWLSADSPDNMTFNNCNRILSARQVK